MRYGIFCLIFCQGAWSTIRYYLADLILAPDDDIEMKTQRFEAFQLTVASQLEKKERLVQITLESDKENVDWRI